VKSIVQNSGRCVVQTAAGKRFVCDDVVLAIPPSVWSGLTLDPALPFEGHPQMGVAVKWLARVDGRFWSEDEISSNALTNGDLSATWEGTKGQPGDGEAGLVGFSGGLAARDVLRREPKAREEWYRREMQVLYPGFARHFKDSKFADWPSEAWTKGAYSFSAPGQVTTMGPILRAGVGNLHFAGEHTCFAFTGYMEGGLNSGVSLARRLAERDGIAKKS
jgi:monoamine oxidase